MPRKIDTGDIVLHKPTGETWTVALVDGDSLSWFGWPEGRAKLHDCELIEKATTEERQRLLREMTSIRENDHRIPHWGCLLWKESDAKET